MKYKKIILKPIYNYIPKENETLSGKSRENQTKLKENKIKNNTLENIGVSYFQKPKQKENSSSRNLNVTKVFENSKVENKTVNTSTKQYIKEDLLKNENYTKILKETDELIKKLKTISNLEKEKTKGFLVSPEKIKNILNSSNATLEQNSFKKENVSKVYTKVLKEKNKHVNVKHKEENITQELFKLINNQSNISTLKYFVKNNKAILLLDLFLVFVFLFIILKLIKFIFKKPTIPEELLYITIRDPFEDAVEKTKYLPKIGTIIVKSEEDIPSSVCILGDLVIIGKVKLPEYVYVKGDVRAEEFVEIDTLVCEKNVILQNGGYLKTLLASRKIIDLPKNFESKGIILGEQIRTYNYKDYEFELPIASSKRQILEYKGNFKVPEDMTLAQDLIIYGNLEVLPFAKILGDIRVYGNVKIWNNVKISGGIYASGKVYISENCIIGKDIISSNKIEILPGCRLNIFSGRIATYKNITFHENVCCFGVVISPLKVK